MVISAVIFRTLSSSRQHSRSAEKHNLPFSLRRFLSPLFKLSSVSRGLRGSQVCRRCLQVVLAPTFPSYWPVPLLPQRDAVAGTNLFGILEKSRRSGDDPTGQPAQGKKTTKQKRTKKFKIPKIPTLDQFKVPEIIILIPALRHIAFFIT